MVLDRYDPRLIEALEASTANAFGLLDPDGNLIWSNAGLRDLLGDPMPDQPRFAYLANPDPVMLLESPPGETPIFEGFLTAGGEAASRSLRARICRRPEGLLIYAEYDAQELAALNRGLTEPLQENNNLRRELLKSNRSLRQAAEELRLSEERYQLANQITFNAI